MSSKFNKQEFEKDPLMNLISSCILIFGVNLISMKSFDVIPHSWWFVIGVPILMMLAFMVLGGIFFRHDPEEEMKVIQELEEEVQKVFVDFIKQGNRPVNHIDIKCTIDKEENHDKDFKYRRIHDMSEEERKELTNEVKDIMTKKEGEKDGK